MFRVPPDRKDRLASPVGQEVPERPAPTDRPDIPELRATRARSAPLVPMEIRVLPGLQVRPAIRPLARVGLAEADKEELERPVRSVRLVRPDSAALPE